MKIIEFNWDPSSRQLRQFGLICLFALPLIAWLWRANLPTIGILASVGLAIAVISLAAPKYVKPAFIGLSLLAMPIGIVLGELAMLAIYFGVFLPIGLVFRLMRRDALRLQMNRDAETFWQPKLRASDVTSYFRQF